MTSRRLGRDVEIAVDHPQPAGLRHGDRHARLGHRVHRRADQRDVERDLRRDEGPGVRPARQHVRGARHQQHVVESQRLAQFHCRISRKARPVRAVLFHGRRGIESPRRGCASRMPPASATDARGSMPRAAVPPQASGRARKSGGDEIFLAELSVRLAGGLTCTTLAKARLSTGDQLRLGAARQHLGDEGSARRQHRHREIRRRLAERHDPQMVGRRHVPRPARPCPTSPRRRSPPSQGRAPPPPRPRRGSRATCSSAPATGVHLLQIERDHPAARLAPRRAEGVHPRHRDLGPAARRRAEIDHPGARHQKAETLVDLGDLVGGAAAIALGPRPRHDRGRSAAARASAWTTACGPWRS